MFSVRNKIRRFFKLKRHPPHYKDDQARHSRIQAPSNTSLRPTKPATKVESPNIHQSNVQHSIEDAEDRGGKLQEPATSLWDRAYQLLKDSETDSGMVQKFEALAAHELIPAGSKQRLQSGADSVENTETLDPQSANRVEMVRLIQEGLNRTAKTAKAKEAAKTGVDFILQFKDAIDTAVKASEAAAAVWTGISLGLNMFLAPLEASETNRSGIVYVVGRMKWYDSLSNLLLRENIALDTDFALLRASLENTILDLYKAIIKFTTLSALSYYRNQGLQFLRDFVLDDWEALVQVVKDTEDSVPHKSSQVKSKGLT